MRKEDRERFQDETEENSIIELEQNSRSETFRATVYLLDEEILINLNKKLVHFYFI